MNKAFLVFAALSVVFCANISNLCQDSERNVTACYEIFQPVCAFSSTANGVTKITRENRCAACSSASVKYIAQGSCESYPSNANFCDPAESKSHICMMIIMPVCGVSDSNVSQTYGNSCFACTNSSVVYY